jgi:hypothetical protein
MKRVCLAVMFLTGISCFFGCSSAPVKETSSNKPASTESAPKKEPILYTGKSCFTRMLDQAQRWAPDALPFHAESALNSESTGRDGKATIWKAMFASPSKGRYKTFTCSGSRLPEEPAPGVSGSAESIPPASTPLFHPSYLSTDTDKAFALAQEKGGSKLFEKNPRQPVVYSLDWDPQKKQLVWVVIYGTGLKDSKGVGIVDASTGKFLRASK